jgi:predicted nucleic acid-binding protein
MTAAAIDASAYIAIVNNHPQSDMILDAIQQCDTTVAPQLFTVEVANVLSKYVRRGDIEPSIAQERLWDARRFIDEYSEDGELLAEAYSEAVRLQHSVYGMLYLVCARRNDATLLTLDRRLSDLAAREGLRVHGFPDAIPAE